MKKWTPKTRLASLFFSLLVLSLFPFKLTLAEETGLCICVVDFDAGSLNTQEDVTESQCTTLCANASFCPTGAARRTCNFGAGVSGAENVAAVINEVSSTEGFGAKAPTPTSLEDVSKIKGLPFETVPSLINFYMRGTLGIIGIWALLFFLYAGILWLTSGGSPDKIKKAQQIMVWTTIGIIVIFAGYTITSAIITAVGG